MSEVLKKRGVVRLYACGGLGLNIGAKFESRRGKVEAGFAGVEVSYIDTSRSNLSNDIPNDHVYLLPDVDGSGKIRRENADAITQRVREILHSHKPLDMNIVVFSAGGGSGSVIGPSIISELLARKEPVLAVTVGSASTGIDARNTLGTIKTLEAISKLRKSSVAVSYFRNNGEHGSRGQVDHHVDAAIVALLLLYSGLNEELDSSDLFNWLNFDRATPFEPQLAALQLPEGQPDPADCRSIYSAATLAKKGSSTDLMFRPEYHCYGFYPTEAQSTAKSEALHFLIGGDTLDQEVRELNKILGELDEQNQARVNRGGFLTNADQPTETGLVL